MRSFINKLFGGGAEEAKEPEVIPLAEVPRRIERKEIVIHARLARNAAPAREGILTSVAALKSQIDALESAESVEPSPPKLRKVVENSLPAFVKAMNIALDRHFSDDIEEFYAQIVELVKSSAKNLHGKGKYLKLVFPEQMKEIRTTIDAIGRDLNLLTGEMKSAQQAMQEVSEVRDQYRLLRQDQEEYQVKLRAWRQIWEQIPRDEERLRLIDREIAAITGDPRFTTVEMTLERISRQNAEIGAIREEFQKVANTASSVLKKAEHAAQDGGNTPLAGDLRTIRMWLERPSSEERRRIRELLERVNPEILGMVAAGSVPLKNKTEIRLFAAEGVLPETIGDLCSRYEASRDDIRDARIEIDVSTVLRQKEELERKRANIRERHTGDMARITAFEGELDEIRGRLPERVAILSRLMSGLCTQEIRIETDPFDQPAGRRQ